MSFSFLSFFFACKVFLRVQLCVFSDLADAKSGSREPGVPGDDGQRGSPREMVAGKGREKRKVDLGLFMERKRSSGV